MAQETAALPQPKPIEFDPKIELGRAGLKQFSGFVLEDFLPQLRGQKAAAAFREIVDNSALVRGILNLLELSLRRVNLFMEPFADENGQTTKEDEDRAKRVEQALEDMSVSREDMMSEICTMLPYGFAPMEIVYKKCGGWSNDPTTRSRYSDGLIMWRKIALRAQDTLFRWEFDEDGGVRAMVQLPPPDYRMRTIPIEKMLLFRPRVEKGNPEGYSLLRSGYFNWLMIKRLTEYEAIKGERDATGIPVIKLPSVNMLPGATPAQARVYTALKNMGKNLRNDEQACAIIPSDVDPITKVPLFEMEILQGNGEAIFDYDKVITRHEVRLAISMLADGMLLGHDKVGSFALSETKSRSTMGAALEAWLDAICGVFNRHALPRLWELNGWPMDRIAKMGHGDVQVVDTEALAKTVQALAQAGMALFPDEDLDAHIREEMNWPARSQESIDAEQDKLQAQQDLNDRLTQAPPPGQLPGQEGQQPPPPQQQIGKRRRVAKAPHQPRNVRGKYAPPAAADALSLLRERQTIGANDTVSHGFKVANPIPFDPKSMGHTLNVDNAPLERVQLKDLIATQPNVKRETVRALIENPNIVAAGQRNLAGQLNDRPIVIRHEGKSYIADGHHRLAAKKLIGARDALVRMIDHDAPANQGQPYNTGSVNKSEEAS